MFKFINHNKFYIFFLITFIIVNLSIFFLNKKNFFRYYKNEINFFATEIDRSKFYKHQFTIIDYIKLQLGVDYKFKNFKITGPNFSKISVGIKGFKNEKKTDYIRSTYLLTFSISSSSKERINYISNSIGISLPTVMNFLNSIDLLNYLSFVQSRIEFICHNSILDFNFDKNNCIKMKNLLNNTYQKISDIDLNSLLIGNIPINDLKQLKPIKKNISDLKKIFLNYDELKENYPIYYDETIKFLTKGEEFEIDKIMKSGKDSFRIVKQPLSVMSLNYNHVNKVLVYVNLILLLIIFAIKYLILIKQKK